MVAYGIRAALWRIENLNFSFLDHTTAYSKRFFKTSIVCSSFKQPDATKFLNNISLKRTFKATSTQCTVQIRKFSRFSQCLYSSKDEDSENIQDDKDIDEFLVDQKYAELFTETYIRPLGGNRVFAVQPDMKNIPKKKKVTTAELQLAELCALVETLPQWTVVDKSITSLKFLDKKHVFGKGNFHDIGQKIRRNRDVTAAVLGLNMLNSVQLASLQDEWGVPIYDRYTIVLQIFQQRAKTREAKLQVALAEIPYYRSRLRGMHSGTLDQQKGGMNVVGGSGETYMEIRQRLLQDRELRLQKELAKIRSQRETIRTQRKKREFPVVAIVGYTNAGKTSLIKALTGEVEMQPRDQLFATLDVTAHSGFLPNRMKVIYIDTVGFISDIPTTLIQSFSATLEDVTNADLLIHISDISHPDAVAQRLNVCETLAGLQLPQILMDNMIEVYNKVDILTKEERESVASDKSLMLSVHEGWGMAELQNRIQDALLKTTGRIRKCLKVAMGSPIIGWLYKEGTVENTRPDESNPEKLLVDVIMTEAVFSKFRAKFESKRSDRVGK